MRALCLTLMLIALPLTIPLSYATPPTSLDLSYDMASNTLHVKAAHVSDRLERHYIRRMVVSVNGEVKESVYFPRQQSPAGFETNYALIAKPGDKIAVELFCSQGGSKSAETKVPELQQKNEQP